MLVPNLHEASYGAPLGIVTLFTRYKTDLFYVINNTFVFITILSCKEIRLSLKENKTFCLIIILSFKENKTFFLIVIVSSKNIKLSV